MSRHRKPLRPEQWSKLPDSELLQIRVRDLGLQIAGSPMEPRIRQLHEELDASGIRYHPPCYLSDEWHCPERVPKIGIPFYLAHPRLKKLQKRMMLEVEGGTDSWCMRLLRHEAGHAINYAYELFRRTRWRQLFGRLSAPYSDSYLARPYSRKYVTHLANNYAQAHPEEDFAETFAVCITPGSNWRQRYAGWPAIKKLLYVDRVIRQIGPLPPRVTDSQELAPASRMRSTLAAYYERMQRQLGEWFPGFYDPGLQRLFVERAVSPEGIKAADFLRHWRKRIVQSVCMWTGDRRYDVNELMGLLARRANALGLYLGKAEPETLSEVAAFVTAVMSRVQIFREKASSR